MFRYVWDVYLNGKFTGNTFSVRSKDRQRNPDDVLAEHIYEDPNVRYIFKGIENA